jgi:hypothetical protein
MNERAQKKYYEVSRDGMIKVYPTVRGGAREEGKLRRVLMK